MNRLYEFFYSEISRLENEIIEIKEKCKENEIEIKTFEARKNFDSKASSADGIFSVNKNINVEQKNENFQGSIDDLCKNSFFLNSQLEELKIRKSDIEKLLVDLKELEKTNNEYIITKLNSVINKIDNCRKMISNDPSRVKSELKEIESNIRECIKNSDNKKEVTAKGNVELPDKTITELITDIVDDYNSKCKIVLQLSLPKNSKPVMKIAKVNAVNYLTAMIDNSIASGIVDSAEIKLSFRTDKVYIDYVDEFNKYTFSCNA